MEEIELELSGMPNPERVVELSMSINEEKNDTEKRERVPNQVKVEQEETEETTQDDIQQGGGVTIEDAIRHAGGMGRF